MAGCTKHTRVWVCTCALTHVWLCGDGTLSSLELSQVSELAQMHGSGCYRGVGPSGGGQHRHNPTGEAEAAAGTPLEVPLGERGLFSTGLSAPLCSLPRQGLCLTLCPAQAFM